MSSISRTVVVTGASRGLGAAISMELARRGFTVGCLSRKGIGPEDQEVPADIAKSMINLPCDITDEDEARATLAKLVETTGAMDAIVNNAGIHKQGLSSEFSTVDFAKVMTVNATAVFAMCREAHPFLVASGGGLIVNIGSHYDKMGVRQHAAYCAAKAAVGAITRCLAVEWARDRIRVIDVAPGFTLTDLNKPHMESKKFREFIAKAIPLGRPGEPEEVARFVAALIDEDIPFATGETYYLDGAQAISN
ncbi:MAG: SDR family NAD(P)-dependent oxidoreductase [Alphaproteobacteria bacterium]|nr:SDR family NAD(P)-dependent oxidoreductase [Alphaproteobacteria bacterium]